MTETVLILLAFVVFAIFFERIKLGSIIGLLLGGIIVGPYGIGIVQSIEAVDTLAELGITFLLFTIGLELKISRLRLYGLSTYGLAVAQLCGTAAVIAAIAYGMGFDTRTAIVVGVALAFSSTALVLQLLHDLGRTVTALGRLAIAILLIQDIAVGPVMIAVEAAGQGADGAGSAIMVVVKSVLAAAIIIGAGRTILNPILRMVSDTDSNEAFLATVLVVVLAAGWAMHEAGSSAAIGAFLAGLVVAETRYRHQIAADIAPFRGLLLGLFFLSVGAKANLPLIGEQFLVVVAIAVGLIAAKAAILVVLAKLFGQSTRLSLSLGVLLSEGSEFAFIILAVAVSATVLPSDLADVLIASVGLSLIIIAFVGRAGRVLLDRLEGAAMSSPAKLDRQTEDLSGHVLVIGFGQVGLSLTRHLLSLGVPVLVIDFSSARVRTMQDLKLPVYYGNALRTDVLRSCKVADAKMVVIAVPDPGVSVRILEIIRRIAPRQVVVARSTGKAASEELSRAGADIIVEESLTTALEMAERVAVLYEPPKPTRKQEPVSVGDLEFD